MKRIACRLPYPTAFAIAAMLLAFMLLVPASPSYAASPEPGQTTVRGTSKTDRVEARIQELYTKLKITPAQEEQWNKVAQAMRDNAKTMEVLVKARFEKQGTMTAVEDLKSYGEISQAHADSVKTFVPIFEPLYASMSDTQKKDADRLFHPQDKHKKSKAKGRSK